VRNRHGIILTAALLGISFFLSACAGQKGADLDPTEEEESRSETDKYAITVGFTQVGEESFWRRANSQSIQDAFPSSKGYHLLFEDAQSSPDNQILAIRNFIQQGADYIILEPVIETGWDTVLQEAKEADIPVIVADRQISVKDASLYTAWVGSDCLLEGRKVCDWLRQYAENHQIAPEDIRIVNLQGTIGSTPQIEREKAMMEAVGKNKWKMLGQMKGDFTQAKGRESMTELLKEYPDLNVVYCDNDDEALGAIEAIEKAGRTCGSDIRNGQIMILSFDATKRGLQDVMNGKIAAIGECNPFHGPRIAKIIQDLREGKDVEKIQYVDEQIFAKDDSVGTVTVNGTEYPVKTVTKELLNYRAY
jgi:ABC-type sugar transport system substrate-binding protein